MKAKYIIHTVGPIYSGTPEDAVQLADCYRNSLELAKTYDIHSIAFPAISTGVYGYPLEDATEIAVDTVADWLQSHADYAIQVTFCCFDARTAQAYRTKMIMEQALKYREIVDGIFLDRPKQSSLSPSV